MKAGKHHSKFRSVGVFYLPISEANVRILEKNNLGVLGAYDGGLRILTAQNGAKLAALLKPYNLKPYNLPRVEIFTAQDAKNLYDPDWEWVKRAASSRARAFGVKRGRPLANLKARRRVVRELKRRLSRKPSGLLRELDQEVAAAKRSFRSTKSGLQASETDASSLKSKEEGQRAIDDAVRFHKSIKNKRSKVRSKNRSLGARVSELCWKAYGMWVLLEEPPVDQSLPEKEANEFKKMGFNLPREFDLLRQAIERGKQQLPS